jgi:D-3-phosphoglycerate dehydrogenase
LPLGEALGKLLAQLSPAGADRIYITYGGSAKKLPNVDPVSRAVLRGFLSTRDLKDVNNVNVRSIAQSIGITVEEKKSDEPVTFNEWVHVQIFSDGKKLISAGGTFFGSPNNPRIVRLWSSSVEIPVSGILLLMNNKDRPGIVGHLGSLLGKHNVNIASMSLARDVAGGNALTVLSLDSEPSKALLDELQKDNDISNVKVVKL